MKGDTFLLTFWLGSTLFSIEGSGLNGIFQILIRFTINLLTYRHGYKVANALHTYFYNIYKCVGIIQLIHTNIFKSYYYTIHKTTDFMLKDLDDIHRLSAVFSSVYEV